MALTETPALFFMTASLFLLVSVMTRESWRPRQCLGALCAPLALPLPQSGRQTTWLFCRACRWRSAGHPALPTGVIFFGLR